MTLRQTEKFRYFFQGVRGSASSTGAISLDDITLSETVCPSAVWQTPDYSNASAAVAPGGALTSHCYSSPEGYSFGLRLYPRGRDPAHPDHLALTVHLCSGPDDAVMEWPALNRQASVTLVDQDADATRTMSSSRSFTTGTQALPTDRPRPLTGPAQ